MKFDTNVSSSFAELHAENGTELGDAASDTAESSSPS